MADGHGRLAVLLVPRARPPVQVRHLAGLLVEQPVRLMIENLRQPDLLDEERVAPWRGAGVRDAAPSEQETAPSGARDRAPSGS
jgi:hypothetical protein